MVLVAPFSVCGLLRRFVYVNAGGTVDYFDADYSLGFAPGFDL